MPKFPADVSDTLRDHIKASERLMPRAYFDPVGVPTAGYGHIKGITADMARKQTPFSLAQVNQWLEDDLDVAEAAVRTSVSVDLNRNQYDALVDFVFNVGAANFKSSTLVKKLNAGDYAGAAAEFKRWNKARDRKTNKMIELPGLTKRRAWETTLFVSPEVLNPAGPQTYGPDIKEATVEPKAPDAPTKTTLFEIVVNILAAIFAALTGGRK